MNVDIIKSTFSDNFFYLLYTDEGDEGILIDPIDADAALARARELGVQITTLLNTHSHPDHIGGNATVLANTNATLAAHKRAASMIPGVALLLDEGDTLTLGDDSLEVLFTPGHTSDHLSLVCGDHLFCGDTIFVGGAGNCRFGGDPRTLFATFERLAKLDDALLLYPGHDYAKRNLEFCLHLEPNNRRAADKLEAIKDTPADRLVQSTLGEQKEWSPFFRTHDEALQNTLAANHPRVWQSVDATNDAERAFVTIRALRNTW